MNKIFSKIKSANLNRKIYNFNLKTKFRRLSQPGLSRYTVDGLGTEHPDFAVLLIHLLSQIIAFYAYSQIKCL